MMNNSSPLWNSKENHNGEEFLCLYTESLRERSFLLR